MIKQSNTSYQLKFVKFVDGANKKLLIASIAKKLGVEKARNFFKGEFLLPSGDREAAISRQRKLNSLGIQCSIQSPTANQIQKVSPQSPTEVQTDTSQHGVSGNESAKPEVIATTKSKKSAGPGTPRLLFSLKWSGIAFVFLFIISAVVLDLSEKNETVALIISLLIFVALIWLLTSFVYTAIFKLPSVTEIKTWVSELFAADSRVKHTQNSMLENSAATEIKAWFLGLFDAGRQVKQKLNDILNDGFVTENEENELYQLATTLGWTRSRVDNLRVKKLKNEVKDLVRTITQNRLFSLEDERRIKSISERHRLPFENAALIADLMQYRTPWEIENGQYQLKEYTCDFRLVDSEICHFICDATYCQTENVTIDRGFKTSSTEVGHTFDNGTNVSHTSGHMTRDIENRKVTTKIAGKLYVSNYKIHFFGNNTEYLALGHQNDKIIKAFFKKGFMCTELHYKRYSGSFWLKLSKKDAMECAEVMRQLDVEFHQ